MENYKDYSYDLKKIQNASMKGDDLTYDQAMEVVQKYLEKQMEQDLSEKTKVRKEIVKKDKEYLRQKKNRFKLMIDACIETQGFKVIGTTLAQFKEEMVSEFAGYSVLDTAFNDPAVSDIYVISWDRIFIERNGENQPYYKTFRNPRHFEDVLKRFLGEAGKEINAGDSKIVDFELYQDRGAATHPGVTPKGYSLTIRKHTEEHITRDGLLSGGVVDEKLINLLGMLILGETNIICAGLTGSGKTTTIRAILDHYVTQSNKRMLVCEDTQELFPKNEHTLEMVSVKTDDIATAVPLQNLIYTALRLKPKYIVVGEVRGVEAEAAVEGMETGHSTIFTMHGGEPWNIINRLVTKYITAMPSLGVDVVERIIGSGVDYIFIQDNIPGIGRKVTKLTEVSYDFKTKRVKLKPICVFDFATRTWIWQNKIAPEKIDKMLRRGISLEDLGPWMEEKEEKTNV